MKGRQSHKPRASILGCYIDRLDMNQVLERIEEIITAGGPAQVITLNAEIAYQAQKSRQLREIINSAALVTPDGIGIVWGGRQLGCHFPERVTGIDLLYALCERAARQQWPVFLLGAAPGVARKAGEELARRYPQLIVAGVHHGYFTEEETADIIQEICVSRPVILLAALGAPKQEFWINAHLAALQIPIIMGVGGSFDVVAGDKKRAPGWMIRLNLEWLYRLLAEPSRWKRQMALPRFALAVLRTRWFGNRRLDQ